MTARGISFDILKHNRATPMTNMKPIKILVADDEADIRDLYTQVLCPLKGHDPTLLEMQDLEKSLFETEGADKDRPQVELVTCSQGEEAIQAVENSIVEDASFAIAFLDVRMPPGINGIQTAEKIRKLDPHIEIVIVTGYSDVNPRDFASIIPPAHKLFYFQKPLHPQEISQFVRALGNKWRMEHALYEKQGELEKLVTIRTNELLAVNKQLKEDIDKRKIAEKTLKEKELKYRTIVENISDLICVHDIDGQILETNLQFKRNIGYSYAELIGINIKDLIPVKYKKSFKDYLQRIRDNGEDDGVFVISNKDGRELILEYSNILVRGSDNTFEVYGFAKDITDRWTAEKALANSEKRYRMLFEKAGDAIFILDTSEKNLGQIIDANKAAAKMHGYTRDEILKLNIKDLDSPVDEKHLGDRMQRILNGEWIKTEIKHIRKDGSEFPVEISAGLLELDNNKYILAFDRDITERNELEKKLRRSEKMEAIGTLAGGVAHDLNNILSGIVSYPELLLMDLPEDSHLTKPIKTIKASGEKAAAIVNDLLTLARRNVHSEKVVDLNHTISRYLESPEFEKMKSFHTHVSFETNFDQELMRILGSPAQLSKTIMNLVTNAAESISGNGSICISTENIVVHNELERSVQIPDGRYVSLTVSDSGIGIAPEDIDKIFEPFYTKKTMGRSGTGLGMAVVWGVVQDHNGYIDVESTKGRGTTFKLYFPATKRTSATIKMKLPVEDFMGHGESILIIDDIAEQREMVSSALKRLNYSPVSVSNGESAIAFLKGIKVDLLVLDMLMEPGLDGLDTYKEILRMHPGQKAIMVSGFSETDRYREAKQLGAGAYIKKPYTMEELGMAIKNELKKQTLPEIGNQT